MRCERLSAHAACHTCTLQTAARPCGLLWVATAYTANSKTQLRPGAMHRQRGEERQSLNPAWSGVRSLLNLHADMHFSQRCACSIYSVHASSLTHRLMCTQINLCNLCSCEAPRSAAQVPQ